MKTRIAVLIVLTMMSVQSCKEREMSSDMKIIFLHHSTGEAIWNGSPPSIIKRAARKISNRFADLIAKKAMLPYLMDKYNKENDKNYLIKEMAFPKASPYGWNNMPFDYYNIWVYHAGEEPFMTEPTLEILTKEYQVVIFKHCYPVSNIEPDPDSADINSYYRSLSNYKLQYSALRDKLHAFPETKFILFTGAVHVKENLKEDEAIRAKEFYTWVTEEWDLPDDNIYLWDLYSLQTEGGLYFKDEYAVSFNNSHPNGIFAGRVVNLLFNRIVDVIETNGERTTPEGTWKQSYSD